MEFPPSLQDGMISSERFQPPCGWLISGVPAGRAERDPALRGRFNGRGHETQRNSGACSDAEGEAP